MKNKILEGNLYVAEQEIETLEARQKEIEARLEQLRAAAAGLKSLLGEAADPAISAQS